MSVPDQNGIVNTATTTAGGGIPRGSLVLAATPRAGNNNSSRGGSFIQRLPGLVDDDADDVPQLLLSSLMRHQNASSGSAAYLDDQQAHRGSVSVTAGDASRSRRQSSLHTGSLHTGSLHTGSLHTGSLHTGSLHTGSLHTGSLHTGSSGADGSTSAVAPFRRQPTASSSLAASRNASLHTRPADPATAASSSLLQPPHVQSSASAHPSTSPNSTRSSSNEGATPGVGGEGGPHPAPGATAATRPAMPAAGLALQRFSRQHSLSGGVSSLPSSPTHPSASAARAFGGSFRRAPPVTALSSHLIDEADEAAAADAAASLAAASPTVPLAVLMCGQSTNGMFSTTSNANPTHPHSTTSRRGSSWAATHTHSAGPTSPLSAANTAAARQNQRNTTTTTGATGTTGAIGATAGHPSAAASPMSVYSPTALAAMAFPSGGIQQAPPTSSSPRVVTTVVGTATTVASTGVGRTHSGAASPRHGLGASGLRTNSSTGSGAWRSPHQQQSSNAVIQEVAELERLQVSRAVLENTLRNLQHQQHSSSRPASFTRDTTAAMGSVSHHPQPQQQQQQTVPPMPLVAQPVALSAFAYLPNAVSTEDFLGGSHATAAVGAGGATPQASSSSTSHPQPPHNAHHFSQGGGGQHLSPNTNTTNTSPHSHTLSSGGGASGGGAAPLSSRHLGDSLQSPPSHLPPPQVHTAGLSAPPSVSGGGGVIGAVTTPLSFQSVAGSSSGAFNPRPAFGSTGEYPLGAGGVSTGVAGITTANSSANAAPSSGAVARVGSGPQVLQVGVLAGPQVMAGLTAPSSAFAAAVAARRRSSQLPPSPQQTGLNMASSGRVHSVVSFVEGGGGDTSMMSPTAAGGAAAPEPGETLVGDVTSGGTTSAAGSPSRPDTTQPVPGTRRPREDEGEEVYDDGAHGLGPRRRMGPAFGDEDEDYAEEENDPEQDAALEAAFYNNMANMQRQLELLQERDRVASLRRELRRVRSLQGFSRGSVAAEVLGAGDHTELFVMNHYAGTSTLNARNFIGTDPPANSGGGFLPITAGTPGGGGGIAAAASGSLSSLQPSIGSQSTTTPYAAVGAVTAATAATQPDRSRPTQGANDAGSATTTMTNASLSGSNPNQSVLLVASAIAAANTTGTYDVGTLRAQQQQQLGLTMGGDAGAAGEAMPSPSGPAPETMDLFGMGRSRSRSLRQAYQLQQELVRSQSLRRGSTAAGGITSPPAAAAAGGGGGAQRGLSVLGGSMSASPNDGLPHHHHALDRHGSVLGLNRSGTHNNNSLMNNSTSATSMHSPTFYATRFVQLTNTAEAAASQRRSMFGGSAMGGGGVISPIDAATAAAIGAGGGGSPNLRGAARRSVTWSTASSAVNSPPGIHHQHPNYVRSPSLLGSSALSPGGANQHTGPGQGSADQRGSPVFFAAFASRRAGGGPSSQSQNLLSGSVHSILNNHPNVLMASMGEEGPIASLLPSVLRTDGSTAAPSLVREPEDGGSPILIGAGVGGALLGSAMSGSGSPNNTAQSPAAGGGGGAQDQIEYDSQMNMLAMSGLLPHESVRGDTRPQGTTTAANAAMSASARHHSIRSVRSQHSTLVSESTTAGVSTELAAPPPQVPPPTDTARPEAAVEEADVAEEPPETVDVPFLAPLAMPAAFPSRKKARFCAWLMIIACGLALLALRGDATPAPELVIGPGVILAFLTQFVLRGDLEVAREDPAMPSRDQQQQQQTGTLPLATAALEGARAAATVDARRRTRRRQARLMQRQQQEGQTAGGGLLTSPQTSAIPPAMLPSVPLVAPHPAANRFLSRRQLARALLRGEVMDDRDVPHRPVPASLLALTGGAQFDSNAMDNALALLFHRELVEYFGDMRHYFCFNRATLRSMLRCLQSSAAVRSSVLAMTGGGAGSSGGLNNNSITSQGLGGTWNEATATTLAMVGDGVGLSSGSIGGGGGSTTIAPAAAAAARLGSAGSRRQTTLGHFQRQPNIWSPAFLDDYFAEFLQDTGEGRLDEWSDSDGWDDPQISAEADNEDRADHFLSRMQFTADHGYRYALHDDTDENRWPFLRPRPLTDGNASSGGGGLWRCCCGIRHCFSSCLHGTARILWALITCGSCECLSSSTRHKLEQFVGFFNSKVMSVAFVAASCFYAPICTFFCGFPISKIVFGFGGSLSASSLEFYLQLLRILAILLVPLMTIITAKFLSSFRGEMHRFTVERARCMNRLTVSAIQQLHRDRDMYNLNRQERRARLGIGSGLFGGGYLSAQEMERVANARARRMRRLEAEARRQAREERRAARRFTARHNARVAEVNNSRHNSESVQAQEEGRGGERTSSSTPPPPPPMPTVAYYGGSSGGGSRSGGVGEATATTPGRGSNAAHHQWSPSNGSARSSSSGSSDEPVSSASSGDEGPVHGARYFLDVMALQAFNIVPLADIAAIDETTAPETAALHEYLSSVNLAQHQAALIQEEASRQGAARVAAHRQSVRDGDDDDGEEGEGVFMTSDGHTIRVFPDSHPNNGDSNAAGESEMVSVFSDAKPQPAQRAQLISDRAPWWMARSELRAVSAQQPAVLTSPPMAPTKASADTTTTTDPSVVGAGFPPREGLPPSTFAVQESTTSSSPTTVAPGSGSGGVPTIAPTAAPDRHGAVAAKGGGHPSKAAPTHASLHAHLHDKDGLLRDINVHGDSAGEGAAIPADAEADDGSVVGVEVETGHRVRRVAMGIPVQGYVRWRMTLQRDRHSTRLRNLAMWHSSDEDIADDAAAEEEAVAAHMHQLRLQQQQQQYQQQQQQAAAGASGTSAPALNTSITPAVQPAAQPARFEDEFYTDDYNYGMPIRRPLPRASTVSATSTATASGANPPAASPSPTEPSASEDRSERRRSSTTAPRPHDDDDGGGGSRDAGVTGVIHNSVGGSIDNHLPSASADLVTGADSSYRDDQQRPHEITTDDAAVAASSVNQHHDEEGDEGAANHPHSMPEEEAGEGQHTTAHPPRAAGPSLAGETIRVTPDAAIGVGGDGQAPAEASRGTSPVPLTILPTAGTDEEGLRPLHTAVAGSQSSASASASTTTATHLTAAAAHTTEDTPHEAGAAASHQPLAPPPHPPAPLPAPRRHRNPYRHAGGCYLASVVIPLTLCKQKASSNIALEANHHDKTDGSSRRCVGTHGETGGGGTAAICFEIAAVASAAAVVRPSIVLRQTSCQLPPSNM